VSPTFKEMSTRYSVRGHRWIWIVAMSKKSSPLQNGRRLSGPIMRRGPTQTGSDRQNRMWSSQLQLRRQGLFRKWSLFAIREKPGARGRAPKPATKKPRPLGGESLRASIPKKHHAEFVRGTKLHARRAIIPANINHPRKRAMIIGRKFLVKINTCEIGNAPDASSIEEEVEKRVGTKWELYRMDLSTAKNIKNARWIIRIAPSRSAPSRFNQALEKVGGNAEGTHWDIYAIPGYEQCEPGVDYFRKRGGHCFVRALTCQTHDRNRLARRFHHG